jgi:predicted DNA-binding transcriptional regulator YafY
MPAGEGGSVRRSDRLFRIIQHLRRRRRAVTAASLADELGVSQRTIYRDVCDLQVSGVPIDGAAGVGYALAKSYDLPPLMLEDEEVEALVFGARLVRSWSDPELAAAAKSLLEKVESVLPERLQRKVEATTLFALNFRPEAEGRSRLGGLRRAIRERRKLSFDYSDEQGVESRRTVRPLALFYWGVTWTLAAWCELRGDFRSFRVDRMGAIAVEDQFEHVSGQSLTDFLRKYEEEGADCSSGPPKRPSTKKGEVHVGSTRDRKAARPALQRRRVGQGGG